MSTIPGTRPTRRAILHCALAALPVAALAVLLAFGGCSNSSPSGPAPIYSSIVITGPDTLLVGVTGQFTATVIDTGGNVVASPQITFLSSVTAIATINNAGRALGVSEGDVLIRASGGGVVSNVLPLTVITGRGWVDQSANAPTVQNLNGVHFVSARAGWIVGDLGTILHTTDAGKTWKAQVSNSTGYTLNAVAFTSPTNGIIVGSAGRVLRTQNGGTTWSPLTVETDNGRALNDVYFQDAQRGWIVGNAGLVLRSVNGGGTWTRVLPAITAVDLERVSFPRYTLGGTPPADPYGEGWAVGAAGTILGTHDFGLTWRVYTPFVTTDPLLGVARRSKVDAIAVGTNNRVFNTIASGDSALWQVPLAPTPFSNLTAVAWSPESPVPGSAWAVGKQTTLVQAVVLYSDDGGGTWTSQVLPGTAPLVGNSLEDVFFFDDHRGWAVGTQGLILHTATGGR
jgi:photosystem II stability/assembly factor-like uncharacterized protein